MSSLARFARLNSVLRRASCVLFAGLWLFACGSSGGKKKGGPGSSGASGASAASGASGDSATGGNAASAGDGSSGSSGDSMGAAAGMGGTTSGAGGGGGSGAEAATGGLGGMTMTGDVPTITIGSAELKLVVCAPDVIRVAYATNAAFFTRQTLATAPKR